MDAPIGADPPENGPVIAILMLSAAYACVASNPANRAVSITLLMFNLLVILTAPPNKTFFVNTNQILVHQIPITPPLSKNLILACLNL
jgi:hypothetical protein